MIKALLVGAAALATALATASAATAQGKTLDPARPGDAVEIMRKLQCGPGDGIPAIYRWSGRVYSRVEGERDRHLFNIEGMNIRQCVALNDPKRGRGYRMTSRELMLYLDPATGEIVRNWKNP